MTAPTLRQFSAAMLAADHIADASNMVDEQARQARQRARERLAECRATMGRIEGRATP